MIKPNYSPEIDYEEYFGSHDRKWFRKYLDDSRARKIRSIQQWAEEEITIPTGPYEGLKFRMDRQPVAIPLYREFDNPHWQEYAITGSTQTGKSFLGFALPVVHCLTEKKEDVILAAPTMEILADKIKRDIFPLIEASRYASIIPTFGGGSKGGVPDRIDMRNGCVIKLMSFLGGDKSRASFTCPNIFFTETDGAVSQTTSLEANPIEQIKARARATEREKRFILYECTVSTPDGIIWQLTQHRGSAAQIMLECPYCREWSRPDREDIKGWQDAKDEIEAEEKSAWHCPECDKPWTEQDRYTANVNAQLMHKGQYVEKGKIAGELPPTRLLGFRFSAVNNMFLPAKDVGVDCWQARQDEDDLDGEKKLTQFVFALPYTPEGLEQVKFNRELTEKRTLGYTKSSPPVSTKWITIGFDVGLKDCWWTVIAWLLPERIGFVMDYGRLKMRMEVNGEWGGSDEYGFGMVFNEVVTKWKHSMDQGWVLPNGEVKDYDQFFIDARYQGDEDEPVVYEQLRRWNDPRVLPIMGHSENSYKKEIYRTPLKPGVKNLIHPGTHYHVLFCEKPEVMMPRGHINVDAWKTNVQKRFLKDMGTKGSMMLFSSPGHPREHATYVKHIGSEHRKRYYEPGKGKVEEWMVTSSKNHWLDSTVYATVAGNYAGFIINDNKPAKQPRVKRTRAPSVITGRGGSAYVASQR